MKLDYQICKPLIKEFLKQLEKQLGKKLISVAVFGSVARGRGTENSDIDLLVVHRRKPLEVSIKIAEITVKLRDSREYQNLRQMGFRPDIFPVLLDEKKFNQNPWVLLDVQEEGIILLDRDNTLKRKFEYLKKRLKELGAKKIILPKGKWYWDLKPDWKPGEIIEL